MPIIEEEELKRLNDQIELHKNKVKYLSDNIEESSNEVEELEKHRLILGIVAGVLLLLLLLGLFTYLFSPGTFMSKSKFEADGYKVMTTQEYTQIKEILDTQDQIQNTVSEELNTEDDYVEDDYQDEDENQESIDGTVIYAVQIGAFEKGGIQLYSNNLIQFTEVRKDDFYKYSLGAFETLEEAQSFRKEIVRLGFLDAFIASYKNGKRRRIEEAY